ncbi:ATP-binding protein, partial [Streptomyces sp. SID7834]|nr:ATP-binding protein [Streptomyces sp. SID7834]
MNTSTQRVNGQTRPIDPTGQADRPDVNKPGPAVNTKAPAKPPAEEGGKKPSAAVRLVALARERYTFVMSTDGR